MSRHLALALVALLAACSGSSTENKPATDAKADAKVDETKAVPAAAKAPPAAPADIPAPPDVAAPPADAQKTATGIAYKVLQQGAGGDKPTADATVSVHYTGWTTDGKMFDSSVTRGKEAKFPLNRVIPGWTEGLQLMSRGDKFRFWIPQEQAYKGQPGAPAGMLVFDIELVSFIAPIPAPPDVAAPPADAKKTASGLAYKVLTPGQGTAHPTSRSRVTVHYTGWTTDGKQFDSSVLRQHPATFPLDGVIAGWTEGLQLMVQGEKTRFWIPEAQAYKGQPGKPAGMLVFDVELLSYTDAPAAPPSAPAPAGGAPPPKPAAPPAGQ